MEELRFRLPVFQEHVFGKILPQGRQRLPVTVIEKVQVEIIIPGDETLMTDSAQQRSIRQEIGNLTLLQDIPDGNGHFQQAGLDPRYFFGCAHGLLQLKTSIISGLKTGRWSASWI